MKRKEQEARIEQQRQEKEKAREDAARERARYSCATLILILVNTAEYSNQVLKPFAVL